MSKKIFFLVLSKRISSTFSLSQFLLNSSVDKDVDDYLYEAKCQLLMYSAIAIIKMNTIVRNNRVFLMFNWKCRVNFRDVDRPMMLKWLVRQYVYYYYNKINLTKIH